MPVRKQNSRRRNVLLLTLLSLLVACGPAEPTLDQTLAAANQALDEGRVDEAIARMEAWEERHPGTLEILDPLAFAYASKGDDVMAAFWFTRIAEVDPSQPEYLKFAAESLRKSGNLRGAADLYRQYLEREAADHAGWATLAAIEEELGNRNAAIEAWIQADRAQPDPIAQVAIGRLFLSAGNLAQAQSRFAAAANGTGPARRDALLGLLETAIRAKRFADAEKLVAEIDREFPGAIDSSRIAAARPQLIEWRRQTDAATAAAEQLVAAPAPAPEPEAAAEPTPAPDEPAVARFPEDKEGMVDAEEERLRTLETPAVAAPAPPPPAVTPAPPPAPTPLELARTARAAGDYPAAIQAYKRHLVGDDRDPEVWLELSDTYLLNGQSSWATATASEAMRRAPGDPRFVLHYFRAAQQTLPRQRLLEEMERAYRVFPDNPEVVLALARAYDELEGNERNAGMLYLRFLDIAPPSHPEYAAVQQALRQL